jgi:glycosyltransferase involved in cell wall biosynthesis
MLNDAVNFVFGNLNSCGGGERLTLVTMNAMLNATGRSFDLTTLHKPSIARLDQTFGTKISFVMRKLRKIYIISILDYLEKLNLAVNHYAEKDSVTINTHGDKIPYYNPSMSKDNSIVYCHYPTAKHYIQTKNLEYLQNELNIKTTNKFRRYKDKEKYPTDTSHANLEKYDNRNDFIFRLLNRAYTELINKSTILTNSQFSRNALLSTFESPNVQILSPPVEVEAFRKYGLNSKERKDVVLVVSRIDPDKEIEKALSLARILKKRGIGKQMIIVGSLHRNSNYLRSLENLIKNWDIKEFVVLKTNASLEELFKIIRKAKIYFHPKSGEHFGISIAEAMAAGLAPIVPNIGGQTEFVPRKFQFGSLDEAVNLVSLSFALPSSERREISNSVQKFSTSNYIKNFRTLMSEKFT